MSLPPPLPPLPPLAVAPAPAEPRWPAWTAPAALLSGFLASAILGAIVLGASGNLKDPPPWALIVATALQDVVLIATALGFARMATPPRPWHFGLRPTKLKPAIGWMAAGYLAFFIFSTAWVALLGSHQHDQLPKQLGANKGGVAAIVVAALVCVLAPLAEEFFFRGYVFNALRSWRGVWPAALITGVFFGAVHLGSAPAAFLVPLAVFGVVLCLIYARTGSLYPCIALHSLNNSLAFGVQEHWTWQIPLTMALSLAVLAAIITPVARRGAFAS